MANRPLHYGTIIKTTPFSDVKLPHHQGKYSKISELHERFAKVEDLLSKLHTLSLSIQSQQNEMAQSHFEQRQAIQRLTEKSLNGEQNHQKLFSILEILGQDIQFLKENMNSMQNSLEQMEVQWDQWETFIKNQEHSLRTQWDARTENAISEDSPPDSTEHSQIAAEITYDSNIHFAVRLEEMQQGLKQPNSSEILQELSQPHQEEHQEEQIINAYDDWPDRPALDFNSLPPEEVGDSFSDEISLLSQPEDWSLDFGDYSAISPFTFSSELGGLSSMSSSEKLLFEIEETLTEGNTKGKEPAIFATEAPNDFSQSFELDGSATEQMLEELELLVHSETILDHDSEESQTEIRDTKAGWHPNIEDLPAKIQATELGKDHEALRHLIDLDYPNDSNVLAEALQPGPWPSSSVIDQSQEVSHQEVPNDGKAHRISTLLSNKRNLTDQALAILDQQPIDPPLESLDEQLSTEISQLLTELSTRDKTQLVASHDLQLGQTSDKVLGLKLQKRMELPDDPFALYGASTSASIAARDSQNASSFSHLALETLSQETVEIDALGSEQAGMAKPVRQSFSWPVDQNTNSAFVESMAAVPQNEAESYRQINTESIAELPKDRNAVAELLKDDVPRDDVPKVDRIQSDEGVPILNLDLNVIRNDEFLLEDNEDFRVLLEEKT